MAHLCDTGEFWVSLAWNILIIFHTVMPKYNFLSGVSKTFYFNSVINRKLKKLNKIRSKSSPPFPVVVDGLHKILYRCLIKVKCNPDFTDKNLRTTASVSMVCLCVCV